MKTENVIFEFTEFKYSVFQSQTRFCIKLSANFCIKIISTDVNENKRIDLRPEFIMKSEKTIII